MKCQRLPPSPDSPLGTTSWKMERGRLEFIEESELDVFFRGNSVLKRGVFITPDGLRTPVAVKVVDVDALDHTEIRLKREARNMKKLKHQNILKFFGLFFSKGKANFVLEYCPMGTLAHFLAKNRNLGKKRKLKLLIQIAEAIKYLHAEGIVHRDLKVDNILISTCNKNTVIKIADFGDSRNKSSITGTMCGTPSYIAPEQFFGSLENEPHLIDVYAFGVLIWELWTGQQPYLDLYREHAKSMLLFLRAIHKKDGLGERPDMTDPKIKKCPKKMKKLMTSCWQHDASKRPKNFGEILKVLKTV